VAKVANYELANLAMWAFDFDQANASFNSVIEQSSEKTDLMATWGAIEGSIISSESRVANWTKMDQPVTQKEISKPFLRRPPAGLIEERERVHRFESFIAAKEKEILRTLQRQKSRLRDKLLRDVYGNKASEPPSQALTRKVNGPWVIAVQRLVSMCIGRAYRRDGELPDMRSVQLALQGAKLAVKNADERCVAITTEGLTAELWFDGRISCTGPSERVDDVISVLELITRVSDAAVTVPSS
jgi:hypothetical protein